MLLNVTRDTDSVTHLCKTVVFRITDPEVKRTFFSTVLSWGKLKLLHFTRLSFLLHAAQTHSSFPYLFPSLPFPSLPLPHQWRCQDSPAAVPSGPRLIKAHVPGWRRLQVCQEAAKPDFQRRWRDLWQPRKEWHAINMLIHPSHHHLCLSVSQPGSHVTLH